MVAMTTVGSDYKERVSEQCCYTSVCYHSGLRSDHQRITGSLSSDFFLCVWVFCPMNDLFCDGRNTIIFTS